MVGKGVRVESQHGEKVRVHLVGFDLIAHGYRIQQGGGIVIFPVKEIITSEHVEGVKHLGAELVDYEHVVPDTFGWNTLAKNLEGTIDESQAEHLISSFDVIGDIAAIEIPYLSSFLYLLPYPYSLTILKRQLEDKEAAIASAILKMNKHVKSVCKKLGAHEGEFRVQKVKAIGGEMRTETIHTENSVRLKLDLGKSYYSPRMANDRLIIALQVKPGEVVGSLFGGVGPFALIMAKKQNAVNKIYSVELNPDAHQFAQGNVVLNKLQNKVEAVLMDAVIACDTGYAIEFACLFPRKYPHERLMNREGRSEGEVWKGMKERWYDVPGLQALKPTGGFVHLYQFTPDDDPFSGPIEKFRKAAANIGKNFEVVATRFVGRQSPKILRVCLDVRIY